jgi:hypothetical protein
MHVESGVEGDIHEKGRREDHDVAGKITVNAVL